MSSANKETKAAGSVNAGDKGKFKDSVQLVVFKQGDEDYALRIDQIKEVVLTPGITRMPQTPDYVKGVANIRGNIIAILNLEEKFGLTSPGVDDPSHMNFTLVIESDEFKAGILVREVPNTVPVLEDEIEDAANIINNTSMEQNYITGIVKKEDRLIILIDILKVITEQDLGTMSQVNLK